MSSRPAKAAPGVGAPHCQMNGDRRVVRCCLRERARPLPDVQKKKKKALVGQRSHMLKREREREREGEGEGIAVEETWKFANVASHTI